MISAAKKIRRWGQAAFCLGALFFLALRGEASQVAWQELKADHFIVYYAKDEAFAREVARKAEYCYNQVASDLGYARYTNFWQWDKRVKIWIHPDKTSYLRATGQPSWSIGNANYFKKEVSSYVGSDRFVEETLPHEITHLVFRDFVGFEGQVPLWLDEGVAQWQELSKRQLVKIFVRQLYDEKRLVSLRRLTVMTPAHLRSDEAARRFYIQAASLVDFLLERFGKDEFVHFCRQLRDGKSFDESLRFAYGARLSGIQDLEKAWLGFIADIRLGQRKVTMPDGKIMYEIFVQ